MQHQQHDKPIAGWDPASLSAIHSRQDKSTRVQRMFSTLTPVYDTMNRLLTLGLDRQWRNRAIGTINVPPKGRIVDLCCGTGSMTRTLARRYPTAGEIVGVDFSDEMLTSAAHRDRHNPPSIRWLSQDSTSATTAIAHCDLVSIAFGLRNIDQRASLLAGVFKMLRPGGWLVILELFPPRSRVIRTGFLCYFTLVHLLVSAMIHPRYTMAYRYLPYSVLQYDRADTVCEELTQQGFEAIEQERFLGDMVIALRARKPLA